MEGTQPNEIAQRKRAPPSTGESSGEMEVVLRDCHFSQPFPGAAKRRGRKKLVTPPLSGEAGG